MSALEVRVRDYLARNGTDVSLAQVAVHLGEPRQHVAAIVARLDLDTPTHVEPEDTTPPAGPTLTYEETAAPKPRKLTARASTGRRSDCPCDGPRCRIDAGDHRHGTVNSYGNHRCRCQPCRDANAAYQRERYAREGRSIRKAHAPEPRTCNNCAATVPKGKGRRHGRCEPCARYFARTGRERPERLWSNEGTGTTTPRRARPRTKKTARTAKPVASPHTASLPDPEPAPAVVIETVPCSLCGQGAAADAPKRIEGIGVVCRRCHREYGATA